MKGKDQHPASNRGVFSLRAKARRHRGTKARGESPPPGATGLAPGGTGFEPVREARKTKDRFTTEPAESAEKRGMAKARRHGGTKARGAGCCTLSLCSMTNQTDNSSENVTPVAMSHMLESLPPGRETLVMEAFDGSYRNGTKIKWPTLTLWCREKGCEALMRSDATVTHSEQVYQASTVGYSIAVYSCRNCKKHLKHYAVLFSGYENRSALVIKIGEWPTFRPHIPNGVRAVLGKDWDVFQKGRQAEGLGLGIGAFAYYRRVVEARKDQLLDEIIKVAQRVGEPPEIAESLQLAKAEKQFKKAMESVRVPQSILIDGDNPLTLLHAAISEGLHGMSDAQCLDRARSVRVILVELVRRIDLALESHDELKSAISDLHALRAKRQQQPLLKDTPPKT